MGDFRRCSRILILLFGLLGTSCTPFSSQKAPIILILLESFSEQDFLCSDSVPMEGLTHLQRECDQFIRFTHVFAPSNLLQPNWASLFTGKEVSEHGVQHNGAQGIGAKFQTLSETALSQKYRTGLFSGGVPLLPKFGMNQGFETYKDGFETNPRRVLIPIKENFLSFLSWIDKEVKKDSFFTSIYAPDLLYKDLVTKDPLGVERPLGRKSNLIEIYESIDFLISELKQRKLWDRSHVVVLGVTGTPVPILNKNSIRAPHFRVPLQIKPAAGIENNFAKHVGKLISFSQLGQWLEKMLNHRSKKESLLLPENPVLEIISQENRLKQWLNLSNWSTLGLRGRQYLFAFNPELNTYDSFFDKKDLDPLNSNESKVLAEKFDIHARMKSYFPRDCHSFHPEAHCEKRITRQDKIEALGVISRWSENIWSSEKPTDQLTDMLAIAKQANNSIVIDWLAYQALYQKRWSHLFELGRLSLNSSWKLISQINLRENFSETPRGCLKFFVEENKKIDDFYKSCQNSGLRRVVEGLEKLKKKQSPGEGFWKQVAEIKSNRRALNLNLKMQFINNLKDPFGFAPKLSELYFFLPENSEFQNLIQIDKS